MKINYKIKPVKERVPTYNYNGVTWYVGQRVKYTGPYPQFYVLDDNNECTILEIPGIPSYDTRGYSSSNKGCAIAKGMKWAHFIDLIPVKESERAK